MRALIFDLDNTLFDHPAAMRRFLIHTARVSPDNVEPLLDYDAAGKVDRLSFCARVARASGAAVTAEGVWASVRAHLPDWVELPEGAAQLLRDARERWEIALLTNGGTTTQRRKIEALGLDRIFAPERIVISDEIGASKPAREAFEIVLDRVGVAGEQAVYVGDDPDCDVHGARSAGMATCWVAHGRSFPDTPGPDWTIQHLNELRAIWHQFRT